MGEFREYAVSVDHTHCSYDSCYIKESVLDLETDSDMDREHSFNHQEYSGSKLSLALLLTCKSVYGEALNALYSTNTFVFCYPENLDRFLVGLKWKTGKENSLALTAIRKMRFHIELWAVDEWKRVFSTLVIQCQGISSIVLDLGLDLVLLLASAKRKTCEIHESMFLILGRLLLRKVRHVRCKIGVRHVRCKIGDDLSWYSVERDMWILKK